MAKRVQLVLFTEVGDQNALAARLVELVRATEEWLRIDFPSVRSAYADADTALASVWQVCAAIDARKGEFGVYAVVVDGVVMGIASFQQYSLTRQEGSTYRRGGGVHAAEGPLLALWLGSVERPKGLLLEVLRLAAAELASNKAVWGSPWALVRPSRSAVRDALSDRSNGFGGFDSELGPDDFAYVDGAVGPRTVYVARKMSN